MGAKGLIKRAVLVKKQKKRPDIFPVFDEYVAELNVRKNSASESFELAKELLNYCASIMNIPYTNDVGAWTMTTLDFCWGRFVAVYEKYADYRYEQKIEEDEGIPSRFWFREYLVQIEDKITDDIKKRIKDAGWGDQPMRYRTPEKFGKIEVFDVG